MTRRELFALAAAAAAAPQGFASLEGRIERSILISMLPKELPLEERFRLAVELGYGAMETQTVDALEDARAIKDAADKAGLRIHSVMNMAHWRHPLSSPDPADVEASVAGMLASLEQAELYGAEVVLLVPAVVRDDTSYEQAWERSQPIIRERLLPAAEKRGVIIGIEEVWNKFLLTPRDFVRYVDEFDHALIKAYFDVGNIVHYGVPQHWIRAIGGERMVRVHLKDYSRQDGFVNLGEGDINWPEVRRALDDVGYKGPATVELRAGDREYLADLGKRVDRLLGLREGDG